MSLFHDGATSLGVGPVWVGFPALCGFLSAPAAHCGEGFALTRRDPLSNGRASGVGLADGLPGVGRRWLCESCAVGGGFVFLAMGLATCIGSLYDTAPRAWQLGTGNWPGETRKRYQAKA